MLDEKYDIERRSREILDEQLFQIRSQTDRLFAVLLAVEWVFAVGCAALISPRTWVGADSYVHAHVWASLIIGGLLSAGPIVAALTHPGARGTRNLVAVSQMLYSGLLIHLTSGRIETHFHVFGSLAILAFYRDCRLFLPAMLVVFVDHLVRGIFFPESVFGVLLPAPWRAFEHAGWVLFEVVFLIWGCLTATRELHTIAHTQAELEDAKSAVEQKVEERTAELRARTEQLEAEIVRRQNLELQLLHAQKMESIGQLAAGIAHEINTPMQFLSDNIEYLSDCSNRLFEVVDGYQRNLFSSGQQRSWAERRQELEDLIVRNQFEIIRKQVPQAITESLEGIGRVIHIVRAMKEFSHPGHDEKVGVDLNNAVSSTVTITRNRWKYVADLKLELDPDLPTLNCVPADINQVLLNLIVNAADAIADKFGQESGEKGLITVRTRANGWSIIAEVEDNGAGIPDDVRSRIFDPFFTTKEVGKGTGQGLAICYNVVVHKHQGVIEVDSTPGVGTTFRVIIPRRPHSQESAEVSPEAEDEPAELAVV